MSDTLQPELTPRPKQTKKKWIIITAILLVVIAGSIFGWLKYQEKQAAEREKQLQEEKEKYAELVAETSLNMALEFYMSNLITVYYSDVWDSAIEDDRDFNVALMDYREEIEEDGIISSREEGKEKIENNMKLLQNPPEEYEQSYEVLKEMYGVYTRMIEQVVSPSGSLLEFNKNINEIYSSFKEFESELEITLPTDVKEIREILKEKNQDEENLEKDDDTI